MLSFSKPTAMTVYIGNRIRIRRSLLGFSSKTLAAGLKIPYQKIQRYENGYGQIKAEDLYKISVALKVPLSYFFKE